MPEKEAIQTVVTQGAIQAAMAVVMVMGEANAEPDQAQTQLAQKKHTKT